jgi:hypothetical protein
VTHSALVEEDTSRSSRNCGKPSINLKKSCECCPGPPDSSMSGSFVAAFDDRTRAA